jgi:hypothetical protein
MIRLTLGDLQVESFQIAEDRIREIAPEPGVQQEISAVGNQRTICLVDCGLTPLCG